MARRRMFAKTIVQSSRFLKMPVSSRELYFQMGMSADDDGVVEAWNVMKLTNAREDDLRVLVSKGYVHILNNEDMVAYLNDWETNNVIRKDRYQEGAYKTLKLQLLDMFDNQTTTKRQPNDNQCETEDRLGKDSLDKDSIGLIFPKKEKKEIKPTETDIEVINYLNLVCEKKYRPSKSNIKYIHGRFNDGFTIEDLKRVIDIKASKWKNDPKMNDYLRPSTLFNSDNFEAYLNEKPRKMPIDTLLTDNSDVESWVNKDGTK